MPFTVIFSVVTGQRPQRPAAEECETELKDRMWLLIEDCWKQDPIERPSMSEVEQKLRSFSQRHSTVSSAGRLSHRELVRLSIVSALPPVKPPPSPPPSSNVSLVRSPSIHSLHHATPVIDQSFPIMDIYPSLGFIDHPKTEAEQLPRYSSIIHRDSSSSTESFQALLGNYLYSSDDNLISGIPSTPPNAVDISNTSTVVETQPGALLFDVSAPPTEPISPTQVSVPWTNFHLSDALQAERLRTPPPDAPENLHISRPNSRPHSYRTSSNRNSSHRRSNSVPILSFGSPYAHESPEKAKISKVSLASRADSLPALGTVRSAGDDTEADEWEAVNQEVEHVMNLIQRGAHDDVRLF
jgi:hypothetical protein